MSGSDSDSGEKSHEPTQKKLEDQRRKGDFPRSADLTTAAGYGGLLLAGMAFGGASLSAIGTALAGVIGHADSLSRTWIDGGGPALFGGLIGALFVPLLGWFGLPALAALISIVAQRAVVVAPDKLRPRFSRISLFSNARNKFGRAGIFEFSKSFVKLSIYATVLGVFLFRQLPLVIGTTRLNPALSITVLARLALQFLAVVAVIAGVVGVVDLIWQHQEHTRKNRMSRKEIMDETRMSEGDPHTKQQRRQRGQEIAMNRMRADVPGADVVVVNPTHFAVALRWSRAPGAAPVCVAKGVDEIAARIREIAAEAAVPIHRDPPTARALFAKVDIGKEIEPQHYRAVATAIRFAESMRAKAKARAQ